MAHPTSRNRRRPKQEEQLNKAADPQKYNVTVENNPEPTTTRMKLGPYSNPSLAVVNGLIQEEARRELRFPQSSRIYKNMAYDANIASAISLIKAMVSRTKWEVKVPKDASEEEQNRAKMLDYNRQMMQRPWEEYMGEIMSYLVYGFHAPEKVYTKMETPFGSLTGWKDFRTISQDTIEEWVFDRNTGDLVGLNQDLSRIPNITAFTYQSAQEVTVPRKKFLLFRHNPERDNPEGKSPLDGSYISWKYLSLIEEFEAIYTTKGLGGILDLGVDVTFLSKASIDPNSDEARVVEQMKTQAANFHNGDQAYVITPVAYSEQGKELFYTKILETNPPNTDQIVKRYSQRMLQTFFADVLQLGADGGGSFALTDNKIPLLMAGIQQHLDTIKRTLNHDLIRQTYELNGWAYNPNQACYFEYDDLEDGDLDTLSKAVQRIFAVNAIDPTEDVEDWIRDTFFDLPAKASANTKKREVPEMQSRAGDGMASGMSNGTGDSTGGGDNSTGNAENA